MNRRNLFSLIASTPFLAKVLGAKLDVTAPIEKLPFEILSYPIKNTRETKDQRIKRYEESARIKEINRKRMIEALHDLNSQASLGINDCSSREKLLSDAVKVLRFAMQNDMISDFLVITDASLYDCGVMNNKMHRMQVYYKGYPHTSTFTNLRFGDSAFVSEKVFMW